MTLIVEYDSVQSLLQMFNYYFPTLILHETVPTRNFKLFLSMPLFAVCVRNQCVARVNPLVRLNQRAYFHEGSNLINWALTKGVPYLTPLGYPFRDLFVIIDYCKNYKFNIYWPMLNWSRAPEFNVSWRSSLDKSFLCIIGACKFGILACHSKWRQSFRR